MAEGSELYLMPCFGCKQQFATAHPNRVPSVPIDPGTGLPPDLGGDPGRAVNQPICPPCFRLVTDRRRAGGQRPWPEPAGGWPDEYREALRG